MAFSTRQSPGQDQRIPANHCSRDPRPKMWLVQPRYSVRGSELLTRYPLEDR